MIKGRGCLLEICELCKKTPDVQSDALENLIPKVRPLAVSSVRTPCPPRDRGSPGHSLERVAHAGKPRT